MFFVPILCGGWALSQPLLLFNFEKENLSLIGTIIAFLLLSFAHVGLYQTQKSGAWIILG